MHADLLFTNVNIATMNPAVDAPYGALRHAALATCGGKIIWVGAAADMPQIQATETIDGKGRWVTPGLIDCHTHLVYGSDRAEEFEARLQGVSYEEIARRGGGIVSTVKATRQASAQALYDSAEKRLHCLMREGVTTVEIKSGYGLETSTEMAMLRTARELGANNPITVKTTFLGAHALPPEYKGRSDEYIDLVCNEMLPRAAQSGLADAVDVFCEGVGFSAQQCRRVFEKARELGLPVKGHVEQLSYLAGARLVAEFDGLSADHIEYLPECDLGVLAANGVVPVVLPGAFYFLREKQLPPIQAMRDAGLPIAVASDLNPGSSPAASLLLNMNMACVQFRMTPEEALAGTTRNAARALGLENSKGQICAGFDSDLLLWDINHPAELSYAVGMNLPQTIIAGDRHVSFA